MYPYPDGAENGPYSIRVLPPLNQPEALWDKDFEPNNWLSHAHEIEVGSLNAIATNFQEDDTSILSIRRDVDVFRFEAVAREAYAIEVFDAIKSINTGEHPIQLVIYDKNKVEVAKDTQYYPVYAGGVGNASAEVEFYADAGGTYYLKIYPYEEGAGSGAYQVRVLPKHDQPTARWNGAFEPNNQFTHAYPLDINPCSRETEIELRNTAFLTNRPDQDWYVFYVQKDKKYSFILSDVSTRFGTFGLEIWLYNKDGDEKMKAVGTAPPELTFTADYNGFYYAKVASYLNELNTSGNYKVKITETLNSGCEGESAPPKAAVDGNVSTGTNPETGEVTIRAPRGGGEVTIDTLARCPNGVVESVTLWIGKHSYPMTHAEGDRYTVTLDLPTDSSNLQMKAIYLCNDLMITNIIGNVTLVDPSGQITDKQTGSPITHANVVLYMVTGALPDTNGQNGQCRTVNTRPNNSWSSLAPTTVVGEQRINAVAESISSSPQITPTINPQITGADGRYAWDVIPGCWYIEVGATGYISTTSPLIGIPPAVTDLNIQLERAKTERKVFLPLINR